MRQGISAILNDASAERRNGVYYLVTMQSEAASYFSGVGASPEGNRKRDTAAKCTVNHLSTCYTLADSQNWPVVKSNCEL